jgi:8-oxo-dGTP pyrophosphatase MutT (NUDIX family)
MKSIELEHAGLEIKFYESTSEHAKEHGLKASKPIFLKHLSVDKKKRNRGNGKALLNMVQEYVEKHNVDFIFGHIPNDAEITKDNRTGYFTEFTDIDFIKHWLFRNGYNVNRERNDFHKVIASDSNDINNEYNPDIRFDGGGNVPDYFWGNQAGGVLIICSRTNKVLLLKRSPYVQEPETWGMISGKIDAGETIEEAVAREVKEETGWKIDNLIPSYVFKKNDFTFYNFISVVDIEFTPTLDWENTDYGWFDLDNLPENLHFGLEILLLKENLNDLQLLDNKKAEYFKEGGYVKSQKVYVSIKFDYDIEKIDFSNYYYRYNDKSFKELQEHKLVGVIGVSKSRENIADWLIFRDCLIVMNYDEFMKLNDSTEIEYDNPEQLMANDLELFNRLYGNKREQNEDEFNTKFHRRNNLSKILNSFPFEFNIAGKVEKDNQIKNELYRIEYFTNQSETGYFMNWLRRNQYIINSPQELADLIIKYHYSDESKYEISSFYNRNTDNLKITSEYIYPIVYKALIKAGSTYTDEEEIIINNRVLNIPDDSQLFFVEKEKSNQIELIDKYKLKDTYRVSFVKQQNIDRFRGQIDKKRSEYFTQKREANIKALQEKAKEVLTVLLQEIKQHISDYFYSQAKKSFNQHNYYKDYDGDDTQYYSVEEIPEVQQLLNGALDVIDDVFKETFYSSQVQNIDKYKFSNFTYLSNDKIKEYINIVDNTLSDEIYKYHNEYNQTIYVNELTWALRELFDYGESPIKELDKVALAQRYVELMEGEMFRYIPERELNLFKKGGRTIAQTPAPKKDQIKGSDKNKEGSSKDLKSAKEIELSDKTITSIKNKIDEHNEKHPNKKITLDSAKAVVRRGMGAYSSSYRPTISGGKPNSRVAWGLARLNAFIYKIINGKSKSGKYNQDDDLIKELGYKVKKYNNGGIMESNDVIKMNVPLFIRMLELAREDIKTDEQLHILVENILNIEKKEVLSMSDYNKILDEVDIESEYNTGGQTDAQKNKISKVMGEFKRGELNTSYGTKVTDDKQAIAIALSEAGVEKKEEGGVIEGQLHSECNDDSGCGEKFDVGGVGHIIEAERDEAVIVSRAFQDTNRYNVKGTPSQIASALNVMGGGKNFDSGATIYFNGKTIDTNKIKKETNDADVKDDIESGSVIINRRSMYDDTIYEVEGTPKQIASAINSVNGYGVIIENGATIKEA